MQRSPGCQVSEFKTMVRELHRASIEVILDIVFNHTAEGDKNGPTLHFRGLDNTIAYVLDEHEATLFISRGVPMLLGGDEFRRTQRGNNNAYYQDNDLSWYDWTLLEQNRELFRFVQGMIAFRGRHPVLSREQFYTSQEVDWFNPAGNIPDWTVPESTLGWRIKAQSQGGRISACCLMRGRRR